MLAGRGQHLGRALGVHEGLGGGQAGVLGQGLLHLFLQLAQGVGVLGLQALQNLGGLLGHLLQGSLGVTAQDSAQQGAGHALDLLQIGRWRIGERGGQPGNQLLRDLLVLLLAGALRRGKEQALALGIVDQQRGVDAGRVLAMGAGHGVDALLADAFQQVGPLGDVDDEPDFGREGPAAVGAVQCGCFGIRVRHVISLNCLMWFFASV